MELRRYIRILRRRIWLVVLTVALAVGTAWATTPRIATYSASATIYVGTRQLNVSTNSPVDPLAVAGRISLTFARMIHSSPIAEAAVQRTGVDRSAASVVSQTRVSAEEGTQLISVRVTDAVPGDAQKLANGLADAFVEKVQTYEPTAPTTEGVTPSLPAYVFERAKLPLVPEPSGLRQKLIIATLFGFLAAAGVAVLLEYLDLTVRDPLLAEQRLGLPVLGVIPALEASSGRRLRRTAMASPAAQEEAFRVLRSSVIVAMEDLERHTIIVTSPDERNGKTTVAANLARALALAGRRVVLVDLDLRHPDIHHHFGALNDRGVADVLLRRLSITDCLQKVEVGTPAGASRPLYLLTTGRPPPNPAELLGVARVAELLDVLAEQADIVLIDTPPILPIADTLVIGRVVSGAVLVVEARRTSIPAAIRAKDALIRNQARLLGLVVNQARSTDIGSEYGYGYGYYGDKPEPDGGNGAPDAGRYDVAWSQTDGPTALRG